MHGLSGEHSQVSSTIIEQVGLPSTVRANINCSSLALPAQCTAMLEQQQGHALPVLSLPQHAGVQVALAMKLGARAVIIANNGSTGFFRMTQTGYDGTISIPSASMPQNSARYLWNALAAGSTLYVSFSPYELPAGYPHPSSFLRHEMQVLHAVLFDVRASAACWLPQNVLPVFLLPLVCAKGKLYKSHASRVADDVNL